MTSGSSQRALRQKAVDGIAWNVANQAASQIVAFVTTIALARLLAPRAFGLLGMITVITNFAALFGELGFSAALVQRKDITQEHLSSVFWLNLGCGVALTVVVAAAAPFIAAFNKESSLVPLTLVLSADFLLSSLGIVQSTLLTRSLDFRTIAILEVAADVVSGTCAIGMALAGLGVWSLVGQALSLTVAQVALLWVMTDWRPSLVFRWHAIKDLLRYSLNLFANKILVYWTRNIDYLLIGRYIGAAPLGIYTRAYVIMMVPLINVSRVLGRVMFPALSLVQDDRAKVKRAFLRMASSVALVTFPAMLGLFVVVRPFVLGLFGPKWAGMIRLLQVYSIVGLVESITGLTGNLFTSQGRTDLQFRLSLALRTISIVGMVSGLRWGIFGVAVGYSIACAINTFPQLHFSGRLVGLTVPELCRHLSGILACALAMAALVAIAMHFLPPALPQLVQLIILVALGGLAYVALVHLFGLAAYREARDILSDTIRRARRAQPSAAA